MARPAELADMGANALESVLRVDRQGRKCWKECAAVAYALVVLLPTASPAFGCQNAAFRAGASAHLPECRAYEMVSPAFKGGFAAAGIQAVGPSGESVVYYSPGAFGGAPSGAGLLDYIAHRGSSGWLTTPMMVPSHLPYVPYRDVSLDVSETAALVKAGPGNERAFQEGTEQEIVTHGTADVLDSAENWLQAGPTLVDEEGKRLSATYRGASPDFCHFLVTENNSLLPIAKEATELGREGGGGLAYDVTRGCRGGGPGLGLVSLNNSGKLIDPECPMSVGGQGIVHVGGDGVHEDQFNAISVDGSEVFFESEFGGNCETHQVFVRLEGERTLEVSRPMESCAGEPAPHVSNEVPCEGVTGRPSADFVGASEDGSRVYFETAAPLLGKDSSINLYMARIGCPEGEPECEAAQRTVISLVDASAAPNASGAEVRGPVRIAADGSRVYFVASGDLLDEVEESALRVSGRPTPQVGADNLYVYNAVSGKIAFAADLCSEAGRSGSVQDAQCPQDLTSSRNDSNLWSTGGEEQANACRPGHAACESGRFLVFTTYARLTSDDTDNARDVYRYDAATGRLIRVSSGEGGYHADGNCPPPESANCDASVMASLWGESPLYVSHDLGRRAISEDGSRVVFRTAEPLSPLVTNGQENAYEWSQESDGGAGSVSLISNGGGEPVEEVTISPEGNDIFFSTSEGLVSQDTDGALDVYDARVDGGFTSVPVPVERCGGDACQGPLTNPAPLLVPGSVVQAPDENARPSSKTAHTFKRKKTCKRVGKSKCTRKPSRHASRSRKRGRKMGRRR